MKLEKLFRIQADIGDNQVVGDSGAGTRIIADVTGGFFEGDRLRGVVLPPAADWVVMSSDGWGRIDVRLTLKTDDDAYIYMHYLGWLRADAGFQEARANHGETAFGDTEFFTTPTLETGAEPYLWLNRTVCVAQGRIVPSGVEYQVYALA